MTLHVRLSALWKLRETGWRRRETWASRQIHQNFRVPLHSMTQHAVERLDLALLVDREHDRMGRRVHIQPDDLFHLLGKGGIVGLFEGSDTVRLKAMRLPDALDREQGDADSRGDRSSRPSGSPRRTGESTAGPAPLPPSPAPAAVCPAAGSCRAAAHPRPLRQSVSASARPSAGSRPARSHPAICSGVQPSQRRSPMKAASPGTASMIRRRWRRAR